MSAPFANWNDEVMGLAVDYATEGLEPQDRAALERRVDARDLFDFERAAAAIHVAHLAELEAPPTEVLGRLHAAARHRFSERPRKAPWWGIAGWAAAAALLAARVWLTSPVADTSRDQLLAMGASPHAWTVASDDPLAIGVEGDVVWSDAEQAGFMRFQGLEPNDAESLQYQLWIFDPTRPDWEEHPIDGGVFDVNSDGEVLVTIQPKIPVGQAALFAVTVEDPGGVVVSKRERLLVTAAVP